jgi:hypothetical protein
MNPKISLSLIIISFGAVLGAIFQYELFLDFLWTLLGLAIFVPLTLVIGLVILAFVLAKRPVGKILSYSLAVSCSCVVSFVVFKATGDLINNWKVDAVVGYVARAVPVLDQLQKKNGVYPSELPVNLLGKPPELLRDDGDYSANGSNFRFEYIDEPAGWAGGEGFLEFDSKTRKWTEDRGPNLTF